MSKHFIVNKDAKNGIKEKIFIRTKFNDILGEFARYFVEPKEYSTFISDINDVINRYDKVSGKDIYTWERTKLKKQQTVDRKISRSLQNDTKIYKRNKRPVGKLQRNFSKGNSGSTEASADLVSVYKRDKT